MELSPADSPARPSAGDSSREFEFWVAGNPSAPQTHLLAAADELFSGGIILPLQLLSLSISGDPESAPPPPSPPPESASIASSPSSGAGAGASRRWKDIFKAGEKNSGEEKKGNKKRKERKLIAGGVTELNINIWPFSRSRSAGFSARPPAVAPALRKASSATCSRSNSGGEPRRWAASPGRTGVHVGRTGRVWKMKNGGGNAPAARKAAVSVAGGGGVDIVGGGRGIACIGYRGRRRPASCRVEEKHRGGGGDGGGSLINLRTIDLL